MQSQNLSPQAFSWLMRCTYGVNAELTRTFLNLAPDDNGRWEIFLNNQLNGPTFEDPSTEARIQKQSLDTLKKSLPELWSSHFLASRRLNMKMVDDETPAMTVRGEKKARKARRELALEPVLELEWATWIRIIHSPFQIHERMVEFWHDHFNVFAYEGRVAPAFLVLSRDVIRKHALGNFRQLIGEVCKNPAMLTYLDNAFNQSANPNENFARELFELHTLGAQNYLGTMDRDKVERDENNRPKGYVDGDVYEAARAFTGWRVEDGTSGLALNSGQFHYSEIWHDRFQKIVLGEKLPEYSPPLKDGERVLDVLCEHPGTAQHVVGKLCRRFSDDHVPDEFIKRIARSFLERRNSPTQIRDTLLEILRSSEFLSDKNAKFKRPIDFVASLLRSLECPFEPSERFVNSVTRCGQRLYGWKTPDGPPDRAAPWQSPQSVIERWRVAQHILQGVIPGAAVDITKGLAVSSPMGLVDELCRRLLGPRCQENVRALLVQRAAGGRRVDVELPVSLLRERAIQVAELIVMSPEFQLR